jgi:16S rRNA (guanine527-N7)-methyltransferase
MCAGADMAGTWPEPAADREAGLSIIEGLVPVSRETRHRLDDYADELARWNRAKNLVSTDTLQSLWTRHIADSAQVLACAPQARRWLDLGSGAGLPGLVVAILVSDSPDAEVRLVESNGRKCAFLRTAARRTGAPVVVHNQRIEDFVAENDVSFDVVTARALAPLPKLLEMAYPLLRTGARGIFHKGQDVERELTEASTCWTFNYQLVASRTRPGSALVVIDDCTARTP